MLTIINHPLVKLYYHHQPMMLLSIDSVCINNALNCLCNNIVSNTTNIYFALKFAFKIIF